jgi:hypothetical protein
MNLRIASSCCLGGLLLTTYGSLSLLDAAALLIFSILSLLNLLSVFFIKKCLPARVVRNAAAGTRSLIFVLLPLESS